MLPFTAMHPSRPCTLSDMTSPRKWPGRLMEARRPVRGVKKAADPDAAATAHRVVDEVKQALGERGPLWRDDGSPDLNRHVAKNTLYADWYAKLARCDQRGL
jgi:hypothetical protein